MTMRKAALVAILLLQAGLASALTLAEIRTQVRRNLQDTATDSTLQNYSDAFIDSIINEGQREVVNNTRSLEATYSATLIAKTTYYALPSNFMTARKATYRRSGTTSELEETSEINILTNNPDFERQSGPPTKYFLRVSTQSGTAMQIGYNPVPTTASTGTVTLSYFALATDLSADSDVPFNGLLFLVPYHNALVYFSTGRIKLMEHRAEEAGAYLQLYTAAVTSMKDRLNSMPNYQPNFRGASGVGR